MAEGYSPERRVYRRNEHRFVLPLVYAAGVVNFLVFARFVHPAFALGCLPWIVLAFLTLRVGVFLSSDGVLVRNVFGSRHLAWDEIARFDWGRWRNTDVGGVYLKDGEFVRAFALNPPFELQRGVDKAVPRALLGLNHELDRARGSRPSAPPREPSPPPGAHQLRLDT